MIPLPIDKNPNKRSSRSINNMGVEKRNISRVAIIAPIIINGIIINIMSAIMKPIMSFKRVINTESPIQKS